MIPLPPIDDWRAWAERWERMQERYVVKRRERFEIIAQMIRGLSPQFGTILDLGCGPGSLTIHLLEAFPEIQLVGIDVDPTLLLLAQLRTADFGARVRFCQQDLRTPAWIEVVADAVDAVVSATALHWLAEAQLKHVYEELADILRPGGVFLNADHVGSGFPPLQQLWTQQRAEWRKQQQHATAEEWEPFINAYLAELGPAARDLRQQALGTWAGIEEGLPLEWHFDQLKSAGFRHVECFWRCAGDAIYGGIL